MIVCHINELSDEGGGGDGGGCWLALKEGPRAFLSSKQR